VWLDIGYDDVLATGGTPVGLREHRVRLPHAGGVAQEDLVSAATGGLIANAGFEGGFGHQALRYLD
jgi:hypothetical protein